MVPNSPPSVSAKEGAIVRTANALTGFFTSLPVLGSKIKDINDYFGTENERIRALQENKQELEDRISALVGIITSKTSSLEEQRRARVELDQLEQAQITLLPTAS